MSDFVARRPIWSLIILLALAVLAWLVFSIWTPGMEAMFGRKRVFLSALFNGITLGALYFLVASGFTLIFGLMRNVNLAHGSLYLFGGYVGYSVGEWTGSWLMALLVAFLVVALAGILMQVLLFRWMEGQDLRQTLVTIGLSIIFADLLLWSYGGDTFQVTAPDWLSGPVTLPLAVALRSNGEAVMMTYPLVRIAILIGAIIVGVLMWLALNRTRVGMLVRAGVDDRDMLSATGVRVQLVFVMVFAFGAGLAGLAGVVGGTFQSLQPGEDTRILLSSLVVVIVGGMGSIPGAAVGALIVGLAEQFGSVYMPTYAVMLTFLIMVAVLAIRPEGLAARR
ncbi:MAG: branched-chain amino acid ABC transporter permease [Bosea sp. (in: a-proteobacteria)]|jgi:branched-chain amino acid transport system permease protein|uniref:branched-chain amino acid ABC transporter permease n=1 Tax=Bosea sp. (in: a-proteobacteria) TaxID=1871050 RepID=UPI000AE82466|nr:branched-chain amino acid ABC transporter permease [Bosea sp. (in: a-proteobacteria)]MDP3602017.1 branched-chain amino acid ABC transporter permease [Bosea sp. (in: a-proteobacteria)]WRH58799.1 MAG: branched-chain amino acid ABC transporter permease [Bosea sp. (in: a-proteobacteria)]